MKNYFIVIAILISAVSFAQEINIKKGYAAKGYDVVSYFENDPKEGEEEYSTIYKGAKYKFSSQKNLDIFLENSEMYIPQYGGYCAYAVAVSEKLVDINPKSFQIKDGKLYLFYDSIFADTLEKWNEEGPEILQLKADENWEKIAMKKN